MVNPFDLLPALVEYGNIAHEFLSKHLTDEQISEYLDYLHAPTTTHGEAFRLITQGHRHPETVFYALESLGRINALCNAAECPNETPLEPEKAFFVAFSALRAGMLIGAVADDKGKEAIIALAKHGSKFAGNVGKHVDKLTHYLVSLFQDFQKSKGKYPRTKEVVNILESQIGQGFIHTVDDVIEWGENGKTGMKALEKRLRSIRKNLPSR